MLSQVQMGSLTENKQAIAESPKFDGPAGLEVSGSENRFAANDGMHLPKPGFSS